MWRPVAERTLKSSGWSVVREALRLRSPRSPKTSKVGERLWLPVIALVIGAGVEELIALPAPLNHSFSDRPCPSRQALPEHNAEHRRPQRTERPSRRQAEPEDRQLWPIPGAAAVAAS